MNNLKLLSIVVCFLGISLFSCSSDDSKVEAELIVAKESLSFGNGAEMQKLAIKSNVDWQMSSSESWCVLSASSGKSGTHQIEVNVTANATNDTRQAVVTILAGSITKAITVTQAKTPLLIVKQSAYNVTAQGGQITVEMQVTDPHTVKINNDWITQVSSRAVSSVSEVFTIQANAGILSRTGTITFTMNGLTETVTIVQEAADAHIPADQTGMSSDAKTLAAKIKLGWNLGNTLEVPFTSGGETGWGNEKTTEALIKAVKAAGFNAIRIPCAWDSYIEDPSNYTIKASWLARVKEVVDYCVSNDVYAILNIHWDGGWLETNPTYAKQEEVNKKQAALWKQIAVQFRNYDEHLLFAGTNEVHVENVYTEPTTENNTVQQSYNQTFVDAVRSTGGKNAYRNLIVQTYNTNIGYGVKFMKMPTDNVSNRMFVEVHYYDPYDFTLKEEGGLNYWGEPYKQYGAVGSWGQEADLDAAFASVKTNFVDKGYPAILGEFGAIKRATLTGDALTHHLESRAYYVKQVVSTAKKYGVVPFYWDNGPSGNNAMGIFNRATGAVSDQQILNGLVEGSAVNYPF